MLLFWTIWNFCFSFAIIWMTFLKYIILIIVYTLFYISKYYRFTVFLINAALVSAKLS